LPKVKVVPEPKPKKIIIMADDKNQRELPKVKVQPEPTISPKKK
jgi:hypothetical protein